MSKISYVNVIGCTTKKSRKLWRLDENATIYSELRRFNQPS